MPQKQKVYLTSPVFRQMSDNDRVSPLKREKLKELFTTLDESAALFESEHRFPSSTEIKEVVENEEINIIGCHLSHTITQDIVELDHVRAVCTATAGYNHIAQVPGLLITHTPSVLQQAVADFIIALMLSHLKNIPELNRFVFEGKWQKDLKWDMDAFLGQSLSTLTLGIIGFGEIGQAVAAKLLPWNMKILYSARTRKPEIESSMPNLVYCEDSQTIFREADIVSLNVPLTDETRHLAGKQNLLLMKQGSLLINSARGEVVDMEALLTLLESGESAINLAFDVFDPEPPPMKIIERFHHIAKKNKNLKFIFMPHTASADADTRAEMVIMMLMDILSIALSIADSMYMEKRKNPDIHLIPELRKI